MSSSNFIGRLLAEINNWFAYCIPIRRKLLLVYVVSRNLFKGPFILCALRVETFILFATWMPLFRWICWWILVRASIPMWMVVVMATGFTRSVVCATAIGWDPLDPGWLFPSWLSIFVNTYEILVILYVCWLIHLCVTYGWTVKKQIFVIIDNCI